MSKCEVVDEVDRILSVVNVDAGDVFTVNPLSVMHEGFEFSQLGSDRGPVGIAPSLLAVQHGIATGQPLPGSSARPAA